MVICVLIVSWTTDYNRKPAVTTSCPTKVQTDMNQYCIRTIPQTGKHPMASVAVDHWFKRRIVQSATTQRENTLPLNYGLLSVTTDCLCSFVQIGMDFPIDMTTITMTFFVEVVVTGHILSVQFLGWMLRHAPIWCAVIMSSIPFGELLRILIIIISN